MMKSERSVGMVVGYVSGVDSLPDDVEQLGLHRRVAFVLDSYRSDQNDLYFDYELYAELLSAVTARLQKGKALHSVLPSGLSIDLSSADEVIEVLQALPAVETTPFPRILLKSDSKTIAVIGSEPWANVGGRFRITIHILFRFTRTTTFPVL